MTPVTPSIITVIGVGGGGGNAVNHMYTTGIEDVSFIVCNTDRQALIKSPIAEKIQLGEGLGAGNTPEKGKIAAEGSIDKIKEMFKINDTRMLFITAGMGGGTGTGAAPVIAKAAKDMGILTVAIVTIPFESEGKPRILQAIEGINIISKCVDSLIIINNAHIEEIYGDLPLSEAFGKADDLLATAAKSIADIITQHSLVNVDFADVKKVMSDSGVAVMGSAIGKGANRAIEVAQEALKSPLLHHKDIKGARNVLLNITSGTSEVTMSETRKITSFIQERSATGNATDLIWGAGYDEKLGDDIKVTVIATGFEVASIPAIKEFYKETLGYVNETERPVRHEVIDFDDETSGKAEVKTENTIANGDDNFEIINHTPQLNRDYDTYSSTTPTNNSAYEEFILSNSTEAQQNSNFGYETHAELETITIDPAETKSVSGKSILDMSDEEMEGVPAWVRRKMQLETEQPSPGSSGTTVSLDLDSDDPHKNSTKYKTINLFDE